MKTSTNSTSNLRRPSTAPSPPLRSPTLRRWRLTSKKVRNCSWNVKSTLFLLISPSAVGIQSKSTSSMISRKIQTTRNAFTVLREVPVQLCLFKKRRLWPRLQPKDLLLSAGWLCLPVSNPKLSPSSLVLPILVFCLLILTLALGSHVERLGIGVPAAQRWQSSPIHLQSD